jgi:hypothetical protein
MERPAQVDRRENHQLERALRITRSVKKQLFVVIALFSAALVTAIFGITPVVRARYPLIADFLLGLSGNLLVAIIIFIFLEQGIKSLHPISETRSLPYSEFIENVRRANKGDRIRILETFSSLVNQYHLELATAIQEAIKAGAEVEVLLFHPYSAGAQRRSEQLKGRANVSEGIRKNLAYLFELQSVTEHISPKSMQIRLYTALPSIQMYRLEEWAFVSLFPIGNRSDRSPNLKVPMDNPFGSYVDEAFEELWKGTDEAPTISIDDHMRLQFIIPSPGLTSFSYFFSYNEHNDQVDRTSCYVVGDNSLFFFFIYEDVKEKEKVTFLLDNKKWCAEPHVLNPKVSNEFDELTHACELIERRYGWTKGRLGPNPFILRFKDIKELMD